ncbi:hypothetical protein BDY19DRAFT_1050220 [Irpex rosettiformis]|uniref:Uncharacterized protein n=1 Tax=Irpex rosettiformis TaxID=378272 RepID=A0ACB8TVC4_9APHY|nr:hypothetical protein BDY19DRAFT_1050220 [Irpex rosettiformis]
MLGTPRNFPATFPPAHDTPSKPKHTISAPVIRGHAEQGRDALAEDVGSSIHEAPLQWFKDNILPPLPTRLRSGLPAVLRSLEANGHITEGRWTVFPNDPNQSPKVEDVVYAPFARVAAVIGEAAAHELPNQLQTVVFECNPDLVPISNLRENRSRPDGYGVYTAHDDYQPQEDNSAIRWEFIVAPGEKKKKENDTDYNDNVRKILWSFSHIMRDDHRRRFVIGYTIENTTMRLWFCSRKNIIVSRPFNFIQDHATLAHFFLSQMYAKRHKLGYDPTIRPPSDVQLRVKNQWDIKIYYVVVDDDEGARAGSKRKRTRSQTCKQEITFRTTGLISSIGAEGVHGRGTRVWRGQTLVNGQMQPDSDEMVMKEYWVDSDRMREAEIRRRILEDAVTEEDRELLKRHLLTPLYSGDVVVDERLDTTDRLRNHATISADDGFKMVPLMSDSRQPNPNYSTIEVGESASQGSRAIPPWAVSVPRVVILDDKSHHRIIFKEKGVTIEHLTTVSQVLHAAVQALNALATMHKCGWVHCDVSSGNILLVDGFVKISDLEYAKSMKDNSSHSERSGTAFFMSIEAGYHAYKFRGMGINESDSDSETENSADDDEDDLDLESFLRLGVQLVADEDIKKSDSGSWGSVSNPKSAAIPPIFRYNPLHDIESVWWLLVYLLLYRTPVIVGDTSTRISKQIAFYRQFFTQEGTRRDAFTEDGVFTNHNGHLHPALHPVSDALDWMRKLLVKRYIKAEREDVSKIDHTVAADLIPKFLKRLRETHKKYIKKEVRLCAIRSSRPHSDLEPPAAAAVAGVGASLDTHQLMEAKKRALHDEGDQEESLESPQTGRPWRTKRARRDVFPLKAPPEESTTIGKEKPKPATSEESTTATKSRSGTRQKTKLSEVSGGSGPLRRSQRNRSVQSAKT